MMAGITQPGEAIAIGGLDDAAGGRQRGKPLIEGGSTDATVGPQLGEEERSMSVGERGRDALVERAWHRCRGFATIDDLKRKGLARLRQLDRHRLRRGGGTMLNREDEMITIAAQIEVAIAPGVELGGAAQRLARAGASATLLGVVDDEDSEAMGRRCSSRR